MADRASCGIAQVRYRNRRTGELLTESIPAAGGLRFFYQTRVGQLVGRAVFGNPLLSRLCGWWQDRSWTRHQIMPFATRYGIDLGEIELPLDQYPTFNAFFTRRLTPGVRPFVAAPEILCCPADGKVLAFPQLHEGMEFPVKGSRVTPRTLLAALEDPRPYAGGAALVVRLAPPDYHRFHFFDAGQAAPARLIPGRCHSVNPLALTRTPDLYARNRRAVTRIDTAHFGPVIQLEIGAFAVASIVQTYASGPVHRGQEKGYFQFGGSSLVLLFIPGVVRFDEDLVSDSAAGLEVQVRTGERLGVRTNPLT